MTENKRIAELLGGVCRMVREHRGWTPEQVSECLGVNTEFYSQIERGLSLPTVFVLVQLAHIFKLNLDEVIALSAEDYRFWNRVAA